MYIILCMTYTANIFSLVITEQKKSTSKSEREKIKKIYKLKKTHNCLDEFLNTSRKNKYFFSISQQEESSEK